MKAPLNAMERCGLVIATGFGAGYCPGAPGTAGALLGLPIGWALSFINPAAALAVLASLTVLGFWAGDMAEQVLGQKDPSIVVIDEIAGMAVAMWAIQLTLVSVAVLFILFRLFDIWKPFPVKNMEDMFRGGIGIMMDDVMAGVYANILWRIGSSYFS